MTSSDKQNTEQSSKASKSKGQKQDVPKASALPLFYKNPEPLEAKKHAGLSVRKNFGFGFTYEVNAVPINLVEMVQIAQFYPIAFSPDGHATPVAILGLRNNENLFVDANGKWEETAYYKPAYIRRYPFIFSEMPDRDQLTLCVDNVEDVIENSKAQPFFNEDDSISEFSKSALEFCKAYHFAAQETVEFSKALVESGVLIDREAQIRLPGDKLVNFSGFKIVSAAKLAELDDKIFLEWRKKDWLRHVYAHLFSGVQWNRLTALLNARLEKEAA